MPNENYGRRIFDVVMLALAVVALVVAFLHLKGLDQAVGRIEKIQEGLSTQYLGEFPVFFPRIAKLIGGARKNLVIACDFPAYGSFSQPSTSETYFYAVRTRQSNHVHLEAIVLNSTKRKELLDTLFSVQQWSDWPNDAAKKAQVEQFLELHGRSGKSVRDRADLLKVLAEVNDETLRNIFVNRAMQAPTDMPIYFWVADCREAVFSIASPSDGTEHGFYSSDKSLIKGLLDVRKSYTTDPAIRASFSRPCD